MGSENIRIEERQLGKGIRQRILTRHAKQPLRCHWSWCVSMGGSRGVSLFALVYVVVFGVSRTFTLVAFGIEFVEKVPYQHAQLPKNLNLPHQFFEPSCNSPEPSLRNRCAVLTCRTNNMSATTQLLKRKPNTDDDKISEETSWKKLQRTKTGEVMCYQDTD